MTPTANQDVMTVLLALCDEVRELRQEVAAMRVTSAPIGDVWMRTNDAAEALKTQGVASGQVLRRFVQDGVLSEAQGHIRNASSGSGRPEWEFNISACSDRIAWFKGLSWDQRRAIAS